MDKIGNLKNVIIKNIPLILLSLILFTVFFYSGINTFAANDDLPYSFLYRSENRAENIIQVVKNRVSDYFTVNGRFFVHCMVQFLLIYDRLLFSIGNAIVIVVTICLIAYIAKKYICNSNSNYLILTMMSAVCFLLLLNFKWLIYWTAGSVNYIWMFLFVLLVELYYLKTNFEKYPMVNVIIFFLLGNLHELSLVVAVILYAAIILEQIIKRKINVKKTLYLIPLIIGAIILLKAPGNAVRMSSYDEWYSLNIIEKLMISVPELSKSIINVGKGYNIIPAIYVLVNIINFIRNAFINRKEKGKTIENRINIIGAILLTVNYILCIFSKNAWLCVLIILILAIVENYLHILNKRYNFIAFSISMYAVAFSMCITPLYFSLRPNYYLYMYYSILIVGYIANIINSKNKFVTCIISVILGSLLFFECYIYKNIGDIVRKREAEIEVGIKNNSKIIYLTKMPDFFTSFHNDCNSIADDNYWAKDCLYNYYGISDDVDLRIKEE